MASASSVVAPYQREWRASGPTSWLCAGPYCGRAAPLLRACISAACEVARGVVPGRVRLERWVRYSIALTAPGTVPVDVQLTPLTDRIVDALRRHPDAGADQLRSGLRFWDHGLRRAYVWLEAGQPLCVQWLLTRDDGARLRTLGDWAGMYPPLAEGCGQVENLFAFSTARRKGVATQFEYALFEVARRAGLSRLVTHIHDANVAARGWADRTGWRESGAITHYRFDVPGLRGPGIFLHVSNEGIAA